MIGPAQRESLPEGHRVGRYTIVRPLGRGGMGVVYVARDERLGREVALKLIDGVNEEATVERFWREARAAASVSHPHICQVYEVEELPEGICLAMELLVGEALDARLARGALAPSEATRIAVQMLGALGALHDRGLVHRDIKPSNVFCTPHGAKVLDFGLTRASAMAMAEIDGGVAPQVTRTGMIMGTPRPWPPNSSRASHSTTAPTCTPWARCCSR
ncbi:MAG: serine/threonine protein kinase, partial [Gemmatimonadetes bacterium]|nr:serine/threonine protein kinase [Gemmatimonadota bacterium]